MWLRLAVSYMTECFEEASVPRVGEFAARLGLSREWATRAFTNAVGVPPALVFRRMQVNRAKTLLCSTEIATAQIARAAAFGSERAFYRTFRDCTGVSPTCYRDRRSGVGRLQSPL